MDGRSFDGFGQLGMGGWLGGMVCGLFGLHGSGLHCGLWIWILDIE
jgi:hypothetical protein